MKYEAPVEMTEMEITGSLMHGDKSPDERIKVVLSAIYFGETIEFSGDTLIEEFATARYVEKRWLRNLFETFYGMCRTDYRIDESIALLENYKKEAEIYSDETEATLEALREYREMFSSA